MAEIISLDFVRETKLTASCLRECLDRVLAKQREWIARQNQLEQMIWGIEHGYTEVCVNDGKGGTQLRRGEVRRS